MVKTYSPFLEITRPWEVDQLATLTLINVDEIRLIRCMDDGSATLYFENGQFITPVENYAWFVNALTELTTLTDTPLPATRPVRRKRKPPP